MQNDHMHAQTKTHLGLHQGRFRGVGPKTEIEGMMTFFNMDKYKFRSYEPNKRPHFKSNILIPKNNVQRYKVWTGKGFQNPYNPPHPSLIQPCTFTHINTHSYIGIHKNTNKPSSLCQT